MNKFTIQKSFAISAGAGSGKTYTLSRRYINAIVGFDFFIESAEQLQYENQLKYADVGEIVTITYTDAAALEMKDRIYSLMKKVSNFFTLDKDDSDYNSIEMAYSKLSASVKSHVLSRVEQAIKESGRARISTIHSYCLELVKRYSDVAKLDSNPSIIDESKKVQLFETVIFEELNDIKNRSSIIELSEELNLHLLNKLFMNFLSDTKFRQNFLSFDNKSLDKSSLITHIKALYPLPCRSDIIDEISEEIKNWLDLYIDNFERFEAVKWSDLHEAKAPTLGMKKYPTLNVFKEKCEKLVSVYRTIDESREQKFYKLIEFLKDLLLLMKTRYENELKKDNYLDFDQIIVKAHALLPKISDTVKYFMVDEFQDTNALQFEIVRRSCSDKSNLFVVGDAKQSIYSFQGAEIEVFNTAIENSNLFSDVLIMNSNHRSDGVVLNHINTIFEAILQKNELSSLIKQNYEASPSALNVFNKKRSELGSFQFMMTHQKNEDKIEDNEESEYKTIALLIKMIKEGDSVSYTHITKKLASKEKAIAIVFDSKSNMLELKGYLNDLGISAKVSASENFYHTKEISDIFHLLKAVEIIKRKKENFSKKERFYLLGALRSNYLRMTEDEIYKVNSNGEFESFFEYILSQQKDKSLSHFIKHLYDHFNIYDIYTHFNDVVQRIANLEKFLYLAIEYEENNGNNLYNFVSLLERSVYFSNSTEEEAFYKADGVSSIELCTIHSTKGLAYPMVILANSDKSLFSQVQSDVVKYNNFTQNNGLIKEVIGFKVGGYEPLSLRLLKKVDKEKHLAEKKRLLYVALTRSEHDIVVSGKLKYKKEGGITLAQDSYLYMMVEALIDKESNVSVSLTEGHHSIKTLTLKTYKILETQFEPIPFHDITLHNNSIFNNKTQSKVSATGNGDKNASSKAASIGTIVHEIIEKYHVILTLENLKELIEQYTYSLDFSDDEVLKMERYIERFLQSKLCKILKMDIEYHFELAFENEHERGYIDLIYYDKKLEGYIIVDFKTTNLKGMTQEEALIHYAYDKQLNFYKKTIENELGDGSVVKCEICWLGDRE